MIDPKTQYEDLKVLFIGAGFVTEHEDECDYDEYIFAVSKEWLRNQVMAMSDNPAERITDDELQDWLQYDYSGDEAYLLYVDADAEGEIVFEGPVYNRGRHGAAYRTLYTVKEQQFYDGDYEDQIFLQTTDLQEAMERYEKEKAAVDVNIAEDNFIIADGKREEHETIDDLPILEILGNDGFNSYSLYIQKTEFTDWRK